MAEDAREREELQRVMDDGARGVREARRGREGVLRHRARSPTRTPTRASPGRPGPRGPRAHHRHRHGGGRGRCSRTASARRASRSTSSSPTIPRGPGFARLDQVMYMQADLWHAQGVRIGAADALIGAARRGGPPPHPARTTTTRPIDAARLLGFAVDVVSHARRQQRQRASCSAASTSARRARSHDVVKALRSIPEYADAARKGYGPEIVLGDEHAADRAGRRGHDRRHRGPDRRARPARPRRASTRSSACTTRRSTASAPRSSSSRSWSPATSAPTRSG